jgi:hypothetical protein
MAVGRSRSMLVGGGAGLCQGSLKFMTEEQGGPG